MSLVCQAPKLRIHKKRLPRIPLAWGAFDAIGTGADNSMVTGWMLVPERKFNCIQVYVNGKLDGVARIQCRQDVARALRDIAHAKDSGFEFRLPKGVVEARGGGRIDLLGCRADRPVARMSTLFRMDLDGALPAPPQDLIAKVTHPPNLHWYRTPGLKNFGDFLEALGGHGDLGSLRRLLDWGCGCGRLTAHFLTLPGGRQVFGCDIDGDAITWCQDQLRPGIFTHINPWPPTPYEDEAFDLVIGCSVFTHLTRKAQTAWLAEIRRILAPGGLFLATTHGQSAAAMVFGKASARVLRHGFCDSNHDAALAGIAPADYYRFTFQTRNCTLRQWSKYFTVLEYVERGVGNYQDLVVMRRESDPVPRPVPEAPMSKLPAASSIVRHEVPNES